MDIPREASPKRKRYILIGLAIVAIVLVTVALARLEPAPPTVERATVWVDTVRRGTMVRRVRGPGTLVPEQVRWISAVTAGRVERIEMLPGEEVDPREVLLELRNPDVRVEALQADRQLTDAEAQLVNLRTTLANDRLTQEATVAQVEADFLNAQRTAQNNEALEADGLISEPELISSRERAEALATRLDVERQRLGVIEQAMEEQIQAQRQQVERLRAIAEFQSERVGSMVVRAGVDGVLVELPLEEGQWVTPGQPLARIVQPGPLKAEVRIPETQATELTVGQPALIDTRSDTIPGTVARIDPAAESGTVTVDVRLEGEQPQSARPNLSVDGTIEVARLDDVLYVGRPAYGQPRSIVGLFRLTESGDEAVRVQARLGESSVNTIQVLNGLEAGDRVVLSDMSSWDDVDRVRLR